MKILLGGVPFGCNNVGDEAILECSVRLLKDLCPAASITVSTNDPVHTASKLQVNTCELFGFAQPYSHRKMVDALGEHDVFVWCGATGLSDYPEIPLRMIELAQRARKKTVVWNVGMNSVLNPSKYKVLPGKRKILLSAVGALSFGFADAVRWEEQRRELRVRRQIGARLNAADLLVVRDAESRTELQRCGVQREVIVGADPALLLKGAPLGPVRLNDRVQQFISSDAKKLGVGISTAAPAFENAKQLADCLDRVVADGAARILFVPMDPVTDADFMRKLRAQMKHAKRTELVEGRYEPAEILTIVAQLDVVLSSRLHLVIFSSLADVPFAGISPGSKLDSFLDLHGLQAVGTVTHCSFRRLEQEIHRLLDEREQCVARIREVRKGLLASLEKASLRLRDTLMSASA